jgi:hypothetical protein
MLLSAATGATSGVRFRSYDLMLAAGLTAIGLLGSRETKKTTT